MAALSSSTTPQIPAPGAPAVATPATPTTVPVVAASASNPLADAIKTHNFTDKFMDNVVFFQIIQLSVLVSFYYLFELLGAQVCLVM
jgi:hypothetical protein